MKELVYFNQAQIQSTPKSMKSAIYFIFGSSHLSYFDWGIINVSAEILFIDATHANADTHTNATMSVKKK